MSLGTALIRRFIHQLSNLSELFAPAFLRWALCSDPFTVPQGVIQTGVLSAAPPPPPRPHKTDSPPFQRNRRLARIFALRLLLSHLRHEHQLLAPLYLICPIPMSLIVDLCLSNTVTGMRQIDVLLGVNQWFKL